ncbi:MAG: hypothetical protein KAI24_23365, partial [Planctomycetes bacterium]|nr:hypothetical protein [Planctomycetota bacterium]
MSSALAVTCLFALQQLQVAPVTTQVGRAVVVTATRAAEPVGGVAIEAKLPDGSRRPVGTTRDDGTLRFTPEVAGTHAFAATIDGVRCATPLQVAEHRRRWLLGLASVPL